MSEQAGATEPYVFLSYTTPDRARVLALADTLEAAGIRVWVDRREIAGGSSWDTSIVHAIANCTVFALTCSPASLVSPNVQQEVRLAWEERRPVVPLLLEAVTIPAELRYPLAGRQWVELLERPEDAWLPDVLRALAGFGLGSRPPHSRDAMLAPGGAERHNPGASIAPLQTASRTNLPAPLTSFIGREHELSDVIELLGTARLLTLSGPGGTGKTRLAISAARQVAEDFPGGVWFVDLAGIVDAAGVLPAMARVLGVREGEGRSLVMSLVAYLQRKQILLVLDNFEQVVEAAMSVYDLLAEAPGLVLLVTSRVLLRVAGEREYAVPPLPLPVDGAAHATVMRQSPAVQLFLDRARALRPDLGSSLTDETARAIGAICRRLDGLPLAIELAAARVKLLPPVQLLARLERRLPLLSGGMRSLPARQQTLRATIQWSWDLLSEPERVLFRRLGVFAGGFTLEAAEAICNTAGELDVLEGLGSLVDQSLVRQQDDSSGAPRFRMLATLQEFALEQLDAAGEGETLRLRHAEYLCTLAETANAAFWRRGHYATIQALIVERDNLLAALQWSLEADEAELGLRLAAALQMYWYLVEPSEGLRWAETFLARANGDVPPEVRGACHFAAGAGAWTLGRFGVALDHYERAQALLRGTTAEIELALALSSAAMFRMPNDALRARAELEEARTVARATGAEHLMGTVAMMAAYAMQLAQLPAEALPFAEEALRIGRRLNAEWLMLAGLTCLGYLAQLRGDFQAARIYTEEALGLEQMQQDRWQAAHTMALLAFCEAASGEAGALQTWRASLAGFVDVGNQVGMVVAVLGIAALLAAGEKAATAARLLGAVEADIEETYASVLGAWARLAREQALTLTQAALSEETFAHAWAEGQALSLDEAVAIALAEPASPVPATNSGNTAAS